MRKILQFFMSSLAAIFMVTAQAEAVEYGSKAEAKAMAEHAAAFFTQNGKDKAFDAINNGTDGFKDRDLYVFVYDNAGTCVAHGANKGMIGKNLIDFKDVDGKPLIKEIVAVKDVGWVEFKWKNPQTSEVQKKSSYVVRVGEFTFGVGAYQKD